MCAFFPASARSFMVCLMALPLVGCASSDISGVPIEQLTVRFNAELTQHWGEYRLIRQQLVQQQYTWQLYTDGTLVGQGQLPLPADGLGSLFAELSDATPPIATQPSADDNDLAERIYVVHITYQTPESIQHAEASGPLSRIARTVSQSPQIAAIHRRITRKLPQQYWFAHLDASRVPEFTPDSAGTAQAEAR